MKNNGNLHKAGLLPGCVGPHLKSKMPSRRAQLQMRAAKAAGHEVTPGQACEPWLKKLFNNTLAKARRLWSPPALHAPHVQLTRANVLDDVLATHGTLDLAGGKHTPFPVHATTTHSMA